MNPNTDLQGIRRRERWQEKDAKELKNRMEVGGWGNCETNVSTDKKQKE